MSRLGIDIGGTKVAMRLESAERPPREVTTRWSDPAADLDRLAGAIGDIAAGEQLTAVGVAIPATLDPAGRVLAWPNRPHWIGTDFGAFLRAQLAAVPLGWGDDGDLAALAEADHAGCRSLLYLGVGTGIGGGLVADGRPFPGPDRGSYEIGHLIIDRDGARCGCGRHGCVQATASGPATLRRAAELRGAEVTEQDLRDAWAADQSWARTAVERSCAALAAAIVNTMELCRPERVRIGGGFATALSGFCSEVAARVRTLSRIGQPTPIIERAALGADSSLRGALLLAHDQVAPTNS